MDQHIAGARYNIHITEEGFIYGGECKVQLTWMDAIVGGKVITPRVGCPVEVNALWYNALKIYENFCEILNVDIEAGYLELIAKFESNFTKFFINPQGTLFDVIIPGISQDNALRPNQIYCLSLPFGVLDNDQQRRIFEAVENKLYTPYGLRTLDPDSPNINRTMKVINGHGTMLTTKERYGHSYFMNIFRPISKSTEPLQRTRKK